MDSVIQFSADDVQEVELPSLPNPYTDWGFTGDDETARWCLYQASLRNGALEQGNDMRLREGQILCDVRDRVPGFFDQWLQAHWPDESRTTVARRMALWERRHDLAGLIGGDEVGDFSAPKNRLHTHVAETLALGGAQPEVIEEVRARLDAGQSVTTEQVAALNRQAKARRKGQPVPRQPQPTEALALSIIRKGELERIREAIALAERAQLVTAADVMAEQRLRDLGKQRFIPGADADFHRMKDGSWVRLPHVAITEAAPETSRISEPEPELTPDTPAASEPVVHQAQGDLVSINRAAEMLGMTYHALTNRLTPSAVEKRGGPFIRDGLAISRDQHGFVRIKPIGC